MVVELLDALEVDALMFTREGVYLDWGTLNGDPLSADALRWVGHIMLPDITAAAVESTAQMGQQVVR